jgi:hypothetical protein
LLNPTTFGLVFVTFKEPVLGFVAETVLDSDFRRNVGPSALRVRPNPRHTGVNGSAAVRDALELLRGLTHHIHAGRCWGSLRPDFGEDLFHLGRGSLRVAALKDHAVGTTHSEVDEIGGGEEFHPISVRS